MAINKVDYGDQTLMDLTEDTVTEDKVLEGETFHDRSGNLRTGSLVIPVQDVEVNGESVVNSEKVAEIDIPTADEQTATDEFSTINGGLLSECKVALSPNQDLHGYSEPWVGGASKQLIPMTVNALKLANAWMTWNGKVATAVGLTVTLLTDDAENVIGIDVDGTASARLDFSLGWVTDNGSYVISGSTDGSLSKWAVWQRGHGSVESQMSLDGAGTFTDTSQSSRECVLTIFNEATPSHQKFYPMLCLSSAPDPTVFAPYTNICPISGHTQVEVGDVGKNKLADNLYSDGSSGSLNWERNDDGRITIKATTPTASAKRIDIGSVTLPSGSYILSGIDSTSNRVELRLRTGSVTGTDYVTCNSNNQSVAFTLNDATTLYGVFIVYNNYQDVVNASPMIRLASDTDPTFVPYNGYQITVNLGGTYYSGTLDVVSGIFIPDTAEKDLSTLTFRSASRNRWLSEGIIAEVKHPSESSIKIKFWSDSYYYTDANTLYGNQSLIGIAIDSGGNILCRNNDTNPPTGHIVYELATPLTIQLTPQQVKALVGENQLSAPLEGQEITEVKYKELFTWDEVEEIAQQIADSKIDDTRTSNETAFSSFLTESRYAKKVYDVPLLTPWYQKSSGATDITFTNSFIFNDSQTSCELIQIGSGPRVGISNVSISAGSVTFTFDAPLVADTRFVCSIINFY